MISLNEIDKGKSYKVVRLDVGSSILRRFIDIGIIPGALIEKVLIGPFEGISAYYIMGTTIAIRDRDAKGIKVSYAEI